ncbi:hypothetical protein BD289DRAFT_226619 [Coniella lustricola]|uniref:R3H domain-containing protein n=1 Tax=Coniella lustricola TaxID=2025994 RepID=A0A2T2ZRV4_9PEZI|nr:hypothetical protein BD289DRAFT_226619 [Coniella lustricola]
MTFVRTTMTDVKKLSFAKVVASTPERPTSTPRDQIHPAAGTENELPALCVHDGPVVAGETAKLPEQALVCPPEVIATADGAGSSGAGQLVSGLQKLKVDYRNPGLAVKWNGSASTGTSSKAQTPSDVTSQKGDSSSDLGTKPPSLDGKSITSGTTFNALDEKESLRPDDSASVQAAAEDDDAFSVRGSLIAGSRMGSEVAARFQRIQLGDMPLRNISHQHVIAESGSQGVATPQSATSDQIPVTDAKIALVSATSTPSNGYGQNPDEKLLEAMSSQKDRLFLLKLEETVIDFVQDSKEPFMDLPPSNSFCRMLTHKLADYYHMTHSFEAAAGAVRIFRTPFCRVPPSLASIAQSASTASTPPPPVMPRKIMRRGENGDFGSSGPSKPTSEDGSDAKDKAAAREKMSREEREEAYNKARERIFGTTSTEPSTLAENEDGAGISRASSVSLRDKANGVKKARRRRDSDTFETRSNYVVAYTPAYGHPHQTTWVQPQYVSAASTQYNAPVAQPYANAMPSMYGVPAQPYPPMVPSGGYGPQQYSNMQSYPQPPVQPRYQPPMNSMPSGPFGSPMQPPPPQPQVQPQSHTWQQPPAPPSFNQSPYQSRATPVAGSAIPYAYGALPANVNPHDPKSQHPIPGSFNRRAFNPKTQSFVPGSSMAPMTAMAPPAGPYNTNNYMPPQQGSPQLVPPHMSYPAYQTGPVMNQQPYGSNGYSMMRQESNSSLPPYHHAPAPVAMQQHTPHMAHQPLHSLPAQGPHHIPNKPSMPQGPPIAHGQPYSTLPTYGNPASLPQKPAA